MYNADSVVSVISSWSFILMPPTADARGTMFLGLPAIRPAGRYLSVNICLAWYDISVLSGRISMKLDRNISHESGRC